MANTFSVTSSGTLKVDSTVDYMEPGRTQDITLTNAITVRNRQNINNAAHEALVLGEISSNLGWGFFWNRDATNYVEIGKDVAGTFHAVLRLNAGEFSGWVRMPPTFAPYAKANTATVDLTYVLTST